ncbi:MAG: T9SS type A sorting domain-containing protein [Chitinophagales bacterium]
MKTFLLTAIMICAGLADAQNWCPPGAAWTYNFYSMSVSGYEKLIYEKDTVISSQPCKKLSGSLVIPNSIFPGAPPTGIDTLAVSPIFTFSQGDTVYAFYKQQFRPIYFFNAQIGDTLALYNPNVIHFGCDTLVKQVVDSTGIVVINNDTLRYYVTRVITGNNIYGGLTRIVEKLGALNCHFIPVYTCYIDGEGYSLRCYDDNNFATYQTDPRTDCSYITTGLQDLENNANYVAPNPARNFLNIKRSRHEEIERICIYSIFGQLQKRMDKIDDTALSTIDISAFPDGTYFLQLLSPSGQTTTIKFIKQAQ